MPGARNALAGQLPEMGEAMIWEKKTRQGESRNSESGSTATLLVEAPSVPAEPETPRLDKPMAENTQKVTATQPSSQGQTTLGRSVVLRGELSGNEDLLIEGQF